MKKLFTSMILLAAAVVASAQNYTVTAFGDKTVKDGDVITCGFTEVIPNVIYNFDPELELHVNAAATITVSASAESKNGLTPQFCGITGGCQILNGITETRSKAFAAGAVENLQIDIVGASMTSRWNLDGEVLPCTVTVSDGVTSMTFTVNFTSIDQDEAGIAPIKAGQSIRVSGKTLHYEVAAPAQLTLYTISGQTAVSRAVNGQGSLNLSNLPAGVYVYRVGSKTGKVVLR